MNRFVVPSLILGWLLIASLVGAAEPEYPLTIREQRLVGNWASIEERDPTYHAMSFRADGQANLDCNFANRLQRHGEWELAGDKITLVVNEGKDLTIEYQIHVIAVTRTKLVIKDNADRLLYFTRQAKP